MQKTNDLRDKILDVVVQNFDYFKEKPVHLAWALDMTGIKKGS